MVEAKHRILLTFDRGHAKLRVRRTLHNGHDRHDQAVIDIDVPSSAVVVGLRTLGTRDGRPHWFRGELMEAEAAAERYRELTGIGGYYPKDPALLSWRHPTHLVLQVFPCPPEADKSVEYTFSMPARYEQGRYRIRLPRIGMEEQRATVRVRSKVPGDQLFVAGKKLGNGDALDYGEAPELELELAPRWLPPLGGALASIPLSQNRALTRASLELAPDLSRLPNGAYLVVVVDTSRSVDASVVDGQLAAAEAYLSHFQNARVRVLTFDRKVHARQTHWVSKAQAIRDLQTATVAQRNGSDVVAALEEARRVALQTPRGAVRRIVLFSDALTKSSIKPAKLQAVTRRTPAVVHLGVLDGHRPELNPADDHPWSAAARSTGGLAWKVGTSLAPEDRDGMREAYEEWARPKRLFKPKVTIDGVGSYYIDVPRELREGDGIFFERVTFSRADWAKLEGELWARPVARLITPSRKEERRAAAHVFGSGLLSHLSEDEMMKLAKLGQAVSPVTSFLAIEPGVRPSTEGLDWTSGIGRGGGGAGEGIGLGSIGTLGHSRAFDPEAYLREHFAAAWQACGGKPGAASVTLETTLQEIVDVAATLRAADARLQTCLEERVWAHELPYAFKDRWRSWTVDV